MLILYCTFYFDFCQSLLSVFCKFSPIIPLSDTIFMIRRKISLLATRGVSEYNRDEVFAPHLAVAKYKQDPQTVKARTWTYVTEPFVLYYAVFCR